MAQWVRLVINTRILHFSEDYRGRISIRISDAERNIIAGPQFTRVSISNYENKCIRVRINKIFKNYDDAYVYIL